MLPVVNFPPVNPQCFWCLFSKMVLTGSWQGRARLRLVLRPQPRPVETKFSAI
jgi:hypothetical protein